MAVSDTRRSEELFYVPFESFNTRPRLVLVGITPGPNQIKEFCESTQVDLAAGRDSDAVLANAKRVGAFGGNRMRPNLLKMLRTFDFETLLGVVDVADLWGSSSHLIHATSVVPHAAFVRGTPFAGAFEEVLGSRFFRESFERHFAASLPLISTDAIYVALGKTPKDALDWCAGKGLLRREQVLGSFAHPSSGGGSRVSVYLGAKLPKDLKLEDPVRHSSSWLVAAADDMRRAVEARGCVAKVIQRETVAPPTPSLGPLSSLIAVSRTSSTATGGSAPTSGLYAIVDRGRNAGAFLQPHVTGGCYVVRSDKYGKSQFRVPVGKSLESYLSKGFGLRMSGPPGHGQSFISSASIYGRSKA